MLSPLARMATKKQQRLSADTVKVILTFLYIVDIPNGLPSPRLKLPKAIRKSKKASSSESSSRLKGLRQESYICVEWCNMCASFVNLTTRQEPPRAHFNLKYCNMCDGLVAFCKSLSDIYLRSQCQIVCMCLGR